MLSIVVELISRAVAIRISRSGGCGGWFRRRHEDDIAPWSRSFARDVVLLLGGDVLVCLPLAVPCIMGICRMCLPNRLDVC